MYDLLTGGKEFELEGRLAHSIALTEAWLGKLTFTVLISKQVCSSDRDGVCVTALFSLSIPVSWLAHLWAFTRKHCLGDTRSCVKLADM